MIKIAIVDDHSLIRKGFLVILKKYREIILLFEASNGITMLENLKHNSPDIILLDYEMPQMNGREALAQIKKLYPQIKVLILTNYCEDENILYFHKNGAHGFISKTCLDEEIIRAIRSVFANVSYYDLTATNALSRALMASEKPLPAHASLLTSREREIAELIAIGKTSQQIADKLFISVRTVHGHRFNLMRKTGCKNAQQLVRHTLKEIFPSFDCT